MPEKPMLRTPLQRNIKEYSSKLDLLKCNIANEEEVTALFAMIEEKYQSLDILINNAGIRRDAVLALMQTEQWQQVIDINLTGTFFMAKQAVLLMMQNKYGRIINITSPVAHLGFAGQANYAASKAGQIALAKSLAKEVAKKKITVNCISPGFIATDFINDLRQRTTGFLQENGADAQIRNARRGRGCSPLSGRPECGIYYRQRILK